MKKFLPDKIIIAFIVIPIISLLLFFFFEANFKEENFKDNLTKALNQEVKKKDSDKDGLLDWEERLYEVDENNPDTDGDGILDGLEVKLGTDPTDPFNRKSREKEEADKLARENEYDYKKDKNLTQTDIFSRDLLVKTLELKQSNLINNKSAQENLLREVFQENQFIFEAKYTKNDLIISKNFSKKEFKKDLAILFSDKELRNMENSHALLIRYLNTNKKKYLESLKNNLGIIENFEKKSLKIKIPEETSSIYLRYLNSLHNYKVIVKIFSQIEEDPLGYLNIVDKADDVLIIFLGLVQLITLL